MPRLTVDVAPANIPTSVENLGLLVLVTDEDGKGVAKLTPANFTIRAFHGFAPGPDGGGETLALAHDLRDESRGYYKIFLKPPRESWRGGHWCIGIEVERKTVGSPPSAKTAVVRRGRAILALRA